MKFELTFVLVFIAIVQSENIDPFHVFSKCDQTVGSGVATCMKYFSPIKFVTDFLNSDKESLCCSHFRHTACINGVRDATRMAKAANLCPDSFGDELISTLTDSTINSFIRKSCKTFNSGKCVMESVGDVVNTIQGFFVPKQQQKPVVPNSGGNSYTTDDSYRNSGYGNNERTSVFNPIREIINRRRISTTTQNPLYGQSVRDLFERQYVPEASDITPVKEVSADNQSDVREPVRSLFSGIADSARSASYMQDSSETQTEARDPFRSLLSGIFDSTRTAIDGKDSSENPSEARDPLRSLFSGIIESTRRATDRKDSSESQSEARDPLRSLFSGLFDSNRGAIDRTDTSETRSDGRDPLLSLFSGLVESRRAATDGKDSSEGEPSILSAFGSIINSGINHHRNNGNHSRHHENHGQHHENHSRSHGNHTNGHNFFTDVFGSNSTDSDIVKDITDSMN